MAPAAGSPARLVGGARYPVPAGHISAPDKQSIYPELAPRRLANAAACRFPPGSTAGLSAGPLGDQRRGPSRATAAGRATEDVYHRTDSHWNERGAFVAYQQILAGLSAWFPDLHALPRSAFRGEARESPGGDLAIMLKLSDRMHDEQLSLSPLVPRLARTTGEAVPMNEKFRLPHLKPMVMEHPQGGGRRALVIHDSFGQPLEPFLSEHFARTVYVPADVLEPALVSANGRTSSFRKWWNATALVQSRGQWRGESPRIVQLEP